MTVLPNCCWSPRCSPRPLFPASATAAGRADLPGARLPDARPAADRRRQARRRGLLVAGRQAPRVSERARAGQSVLSDLRARPRRAATPSASRPASARPPARSSGPGTDEIEFASTHADPKSKQYQDDELAFRASGKERRYSWDYDPEMDIYSYSEKTGAMKRLTTARGYDAEGSYSPDGQWIVFSSMRSAYDHPLTDEEKKSLEENPSNFAEIYIMNADGSEQKRLTNVVRLRRRPVLHAGRQEDRLAPLRRAGADRRRLDDEPRRQRSEADHDFGSMSWAPYMHPSGEYFIFASNKLGFENFELFMVDAAGHEGAGAASPTPTASTACRCPRLTARRSPGRRAAPADPPASCSSRSGTTRRRWKR